MKLTERLRCRYCRKFSWSGNHADCSDKASEKKKAETLEWMRVVASAGVKNRKPDELLFRELEQYAKLYSLPSAQAVEILEEAKTRQQNGSL